MAGDEGGAEVSGLDDEAAALYALPPEEFTAARDARVRALRGTDRPLADALRGLRRPTVSAWLVDLLVREKGEQLETLLALGGDLRAAQDTLQGDALRRLTEQRRAVVGALVRTAVGLGRSRGLRVGQDVATEVEETLEAALADPSAADEVRGGRLARPLSYAGFGVPAPDGGKPRLRPAAPPPEPATDPADATERRAAAERERRRREAAEAERVSLEAAGAADDAQRDYDRRQGAAERSAAARDEAGERVAQARSVLAAAEERYRKADAAATEAGAARDRAEKGARAAHAAADKARAALDRLRRDDG